MSGVWAFITAHWLFSGAAAAIFVVFVITSVQSILAHRGSGKVSAEVEKNFGVDPDLKEQRDRFWQHAIHEDGQYNERLNFFLLFESVLLGVVAALYSKSNAVVDTTLWSVTILGLIITLLWMNIQAYHKYYLDTFSPRLEQLPEFKVTAAYNRKWKLHVTRSILSYVIPLAVALIWLFIIAVFQKVHF